MMQSRATNSAILVKVVPDGGGRPPKAWRGGGLNPVGVCSRDHWKCKLRSRWGFARRPSDTGSECFRDGPRLARRHGSLRRCVRAPCPSLSALIMEERRGYPYAFDMYHRTKAGFEGRQASAWLDQFAARARQLRGSWGLGERPKTPLQRLRQAQLSPQLRVCFAFVCGPSKQARGKTRSGGVWRCEVGCPSPRRLEIVDRNSSLRPPPGCVPKCVAHSGSVFIERLPLGRAHAHERGSGGFVSSPKPSRPTPHPRVV